MDDFSKQLIQGKIRAFKSFVQEDGGDLKFIDMDEEGNVHLQVKGKCIHCPSNNEVFRRAIEESLKKVDAVNGVTFED